MAKYLETYVNGVDHYVVACSKVGCSWVNYTVVDSERADYLDATHAVWHVDDEAAEVARQRRRDGLL